jgi:DNA-binding transcriptional regulator YiaG
MAWEVEYTDSFFDWWDGLNAEEQLDVKAVVDGCWQALWRAHYSAKERGEDLMAKKFAEIKHKMSPRQLEEARTKTQAIMADMTLDELREARRLTQEQLASLFHVGQPAIAKMEKRTDMYLSTLRGIIRAMGGELEIRAVFPDGDIRINQFEDIKKEAKEKGAPALAPAGGCNVGVS